jgi:hypothetical protein
MKKYLTVLSVCAILTASVLVIVSMNSCSTLNALAGLTRAEFKLNNAASFTLAGIDIANKRSISDFSIADGLNLTRAFTTGKFPLTFTLNVAARNPNKPTPNSNISDFSLTAFPWKLLIDGRETISGGIGAPVSLPDGGTTTIIPLQVSIDLKQFFAEKGYEDIINLATVLAGAEGVAKLQLKAQPTVSTPIGALKYPRELTIVSTEFRN